MEWILYIVVKLSDLFTVLRYINNHILKGQVVFISTKDLYNNVHGSFNPNSSDWKKSQISNPSHQNRDG